MYSSASWVQSLCCGLGQDHLHSPCSKAGTCVLPAGLWLLSPISLPAPEQRGLLWLWLASCPVPGWSDMHVSNASHVLWWGWCPEDLFNSKGSWTSGSESLSLLHICYQDLHRHTLNSTYIGNLLLHHVEKSNQPHSYHHQKAFGQVEGTDSSLGAVESGQLCLVFF